MDTTADQKLDAAGSVLTPLMFHAGARATSAPRENEPGKRQMQPGKQRRVLVALGEV